MRNFVLYGGRNAEIGAEQSNILSQVTVCILQK